MDLAKLASLPARFKPWRPRHARLIARDLLGTGGQKEYSNRIHATAAIDWLCRAQDVRDGHPDAGGVSAGWSFEDGWLPSYPETSGYIVESFIAAASVLDRPDLLLRANRIIDWELSIQQPDGAFPGHFGEPGSHPVVFNQGQIMHGMLGRAPVSTPADDAAAVGRAVDAFEAWRTVPAPHRGELVRLFGEELRKAKDDSACW